MGEQVQAKGGIFLEAPVSGTHTSRRITHLDKAFSYYTCHLSSAGSKAPAEQGTLIFMAGGDKALYEQVAEDLDAMGKVRWCAQKRANWW